MYAKNDKIYPAYVSKYNSEREEQVIILMIPSKKRMTLYCSKKSINIITRSNVKTQW